MQAWQQFLQHQETELGRDTVQKWLSSLKILRFDACNLYLEARDSFQVLWFEEHIRKIAQTKFVNGNNKRIKIHLSIANTPVDKPKQVKEKIKKNAPPPFKLVFDELNPHCTFSNYVKNPENELLDQVLKAATDSPKHPQITSRDGFNPIYIYGGTGSGKTHLLMSMAQIFQSKGLKTIYARAETFTDHVVSAIRAGEMSVFRQSYRNIDVLLIDDINIFGRKGATQEEFFHTFNTLHLEGKQIILSANCAPQELQFIEPRLISRFEWGIVLPIAPIPKEKIADLLKIKSEALKFPLPPKISEYLLETFVSGPRSLTRALEALILRLHMDMQHTSSGLTIAGVKELLRDLLLEEEKSALTPTKIIQTLAEQYGIRTEDILGKGQTRECSLPRQLAMYLCRHQLKLPFMKIGDLFCRDHSTVITGIKQIQKALDQEERDIVESYYSIMKKLQTQ